MMYFSQQCALFSISLAKYNVVAKLGSPRVFYILCIWTCNSPQKFSAFVFPVEFCNPVNGKIECDEQFRFKYPLLASLSPSVSSSVRVFCVIFFTYFIYFLNLIFFSPKIETKIAVHLYLSIYLSFFLLYIYVCTYLGLRCAEILGVSHNFRSETI